MTNKEWLAAYLLRFGSRTLHNVEIQPGEADFLRAMGKDLHKRGSNDSAWRVLRETDERSRHGQRPPETK